MTAILKLIDNVSERVLPFVAGLLLTILAGSCSFVNDDLPACPSGLSVSFLFDYNIKRADAFAQEVESVHVWAFDAAGNPVWSGSESGAALKADGFSIATPLDAGTYDFIAWCGLKDHDDFNLATYTPSSKEDLEMLLRTHATDGFSNVSDVRLPGLYHGKAERVSYVVNPNRPSLTMVTIPLMKDTKDIRVMLTHLDGSPIAASDFTAAITYANSLMHWDNSLHEDAPATTYRPWNVRFGQTSSESVATKAINSVSALVFELSTGRLMKGPEAKLSIRRLTDGEEIVNIPLVDYLLLVRGYYDVMGDQEYLDRQDDYSITFFLDEDNDWYRAQGILINSWVIVPPQDY